VQLVLCDLRDLRSASMFEYLLTENLDNVLLDGTAASRLAAACSKLDHFLSIRLPDELSGPILPAQTTLVIELRPRPSAGLVRRRGMDEPRFPSSQVPGTEPAIMRCLTAEGPVRLERDIESESERAAAIIARYGLSRLQSDGPLSWVAPTDEAALDLLSRLYEPLPDAPPILWPEGQTMKVRGELTPASLRVKLDDRRDWFGLSGYVELDGKQFLLSDLWSRFKRIATSSEWAIASSRRSVRRFANVCSNSAMQWFQSVVRCESRMRQHRSSVIFWATMFVWKQVIDGNKHSLG
jgi:hypothetical protein